jgi:hypothetical protein
MQRKNLIVIVMVIVAVSLFVYPRLAKTGITAIPVSQVTENPGNFLGKLDVYGIVSSVYADDGLFMLADEGGCCQLPVVVPFTASQQSELQINYLYEGVMPSSGDVLQVSGNLKLQDGYYHYEIDSVTRNGQIIIKKK